MVQETAFLDGQQLHMKTYFEKLDFAVSTVDEKKRFLVFFLVLMKKVSFLFGQLCSLAVRIHRHQIYGFNHHV